MLKLITFFTILILSSSISLSQNNHLLLYPSINKIDPEINRIKKAKFSLTTISGLLDKYEIEIDGVK